VWKLILVLLLSTIGMNFAEASCPIGYPPGLPCPTEPYELVPTEHQDRLNRLNRLSAGIVYPQFHTEFLSPAEHGLPDYPVRIPVLRVVFDQNVFFDVDSAVVRPEAYPVLDVIADDLKREPPDVSLFIAGHTDSTGNDRYNADLGLRRADAVAQALVRRGIYQASVYRVSFGEAVPIADNTTDDGRARNRRVEFLFGAKAQAVAKWLEKQPVDTCSARTEVDMARCRKALVFEAVKVMVAPSHQKDVAELSRRQQEVESNINLSPQELTREKQEIELERRRIPVLLSTEKIPIQLGAK
tara:strand:- start:4212 stop:5108 length:897 start_codon:yes stop_codon:yes gene_type:complete